MGVSIWKLTEEATSENPVQGDLELVAGDFVWVSTQEDLTACVVQWLRGRFEFFQGEWYLNTLEGTPWFQRVLGRKDLTDATVVAIFSSIVRECPGVATLDRLYPIRDNAARTMEIRFHARLQNGFVFNSADHGPFIVRA